MTSHLVPRWHRFGNTVPKVAASRLPPLRASMRQRTICAHVSRASFPCALSRARFLDPYSILSFRLNHSCHPFEILFPAAFTALFVRRDCRRRPEFKPCSFHRYTLFQAARVGPGYRWRASVSSFLEYRNILSGKEARRYHAEETLGAAFRASGKCSSSLRMVMGEKAHSAEEHGPHRQRGGLSPWHLTRQVLFK